MIPSKELLSEVLGVEILYCRVVGNGVAYNAKDNYPTQSINIYELAFLIRDYFHKKYKHDLDMSLEINEIFKNATQFYESVI